MNPASSRTYTRQQRWLLTTLTVCTSILPMTFLWAPALAGELALKIGLTPSQIGQMFSLELICGCVSTLLAFFWMRGRSLHRWGLLFIALFIAFNLLSAWLLERHFIAFLLVRALNSLAGGSLLILCTHSMARLPNREQGFGAMIFAQLILGTLGIAALPLAFRHFGPGVVFAIQALMMVFGLPLYRHFARPAEMQMPAAAQAPVPGFSVRNVLSGFSFHGLIGISSIFLLYICLGGIWTFIGALEAPSNMGREQMDHLLTVSSAIGIAGAGAAVLFGRERFRSPCLLAGFAALVLCLVLMAAVPRAGAAWTAVLTFKFTWTLLVPFMLTVISLHDRESGDLINLTNLMLGLGMAAGPALCGWLLEAFGYRVMFGFGALVALLAASAINLSNFGLHKRPQQVPAT